MANVVLTGGRSAQLQPGAKITATKSQPPKRKAGGVPPPSVPSDNLSEYQDYICQALPAPKKSRGLLKKL